LSTQTLVCGRWPLTLSEGKGGHFSYLHTASSKNAACFLHLVAGLPTGMSIVEYFGGVGQFATIIQNVLRPSGHWIFDLDDDCVAQLKTLDGPIVTQGDAHVTMGVVPADLVVLDFPVYTVRVHDSWPMDRVFSDWPRYVIHSDTALRRIGLHRKLYSDTFKTPIWNQQDYMGAYSQFMWDRHGYSVTRVAYHLYSYVLLEQRPPAGIEYTHITSDLAPTDFPYQHPGDEDRPRTTQILGNPTSNEERR
jgi:hypothetical protein